MTADHSTRRPELDGLRGVALLLVVAIHAFAYTGLDSGEYVGLHFFVGAIAVPVFFLVDGFLLGLRAGNPPEYSKQIKQSARRLIWPWVLFGVGYVVFRGVIESLGLVDEHLVLGAGAASWWGDFAYSRIATQMYFLPALFVLRALSPLWLAAWRAGPAGPVVLAIAALVVLRAGNGLALYDEAFGQPGYDIGVHALWGLQFYLVGFAAAGFSNQLRALGRGPLITCLLVCAAITVFTYRSGGFVPQYGYLAAISLPFLAGGLRSRIFEALGRESMGIYLLHTPILMSMLHRLIGLAIPDGIPHLALLTGSDLLLTWAVTLALARITGARSLLFGEPARPRHASGPESDADQPIR